MGRAEVGSDSAERAGDQLTEGHDDSLDETIPSGEHPVDPVTRDQIREALAVPEQIASGGQGAAPVPPVLFEAVPGSTLGRYLIQEQLGSGTMGVVLAAIDPSLDRKVALKVVRPDQILGSTAGRQRLVREAQAMARLAHPNVVTVYEVGTVGDHVFVAMEHIAGSTLAEWLTGGKRSQREIIDAFVAAGRGLAAAHAAGIVHRDFKPANVLISADGRVRVADFGLATTPTWREAGQAVAREARRPGQHPRRANENEPADPAPRSIISPLTATLSITATGALLGTPAYMSPEQHQSRPADARADQFSFCVAMYEALYGQLPFAGEGYLAYAHNVIEGRVREAPRGTRVPGRLRRILLRGLATEPDRRYPRLRALLTDIDRELQVGRRRLAIGGAGLLGVGALAFALFGQRGDQPDPCANADQPAAALWDAAARSNVAAAFRGAGAADAAAAFARVDKALSARAAEVRAMRREACVATAVRHEQSPELLDRRMQCLDRRGDEITSFVTVFTGSPDRAMMDRAIDAAVSLPPVARCAEKDALMAAVPPAEDPATRASATRLEAQFSRVKTLIQAGKYQDALTLAQAGLAEAEQLHHAPISARAHYSVATAHNMLSHYEEAAVAARAAVELASAARDDVLIAEAWIILYKTIGYNQSRPEEARSLEPAVFAAVERAGGEEQRGNLESARGAIALGAGDYAASAEHFLAARKHMTAALGAESTKVAESLNNAGMALEGVARYDEARAALEEGLAIRTRLLGAEHPSVAGSLKSLGGLLDTMGKPAEALDHFQRAVAIYQKTMPPDSQTLANSLSSVGVVLDNLDRSREALPVHLRAIAILEKHPADNQVALSYAVNNLGVCYMAMERYDEAFRAYEKALAIKEEKLGRDHPAVAHTLCSMGTAARMSGDLVRAQSLCKRSLAILEKKLGHDHPECGGPLASLAEIALARKRPAEALPLIERLRVLEKKAGEAETGDSLVLKGRALVGLRRAPEGIALLGRGIELMKKNGAKKKDIATAESHLVRAKKR